VQSCAAICACLFQGGHPLRMESCGEEVKDQQNQADNKPSRTTSNGAVIEKGGKHRITWADQNPAGGQIEDVKEVVAYKNDAQKGCCSIQ